MKSVISKYPRIKYSESNALELEAFKEMDYFAVKNYSLPIELMMENAGLQLANLVANFTDLDDVIKIGVGNGNNGGGGLAAARRLAGWGYKVHLDLMTDITKDLPKRQLGRALKFGAVTAATEHFEVWVDAYLGFSQRLPLPNYLIERCETANKSKALKISLDIPTGFVGDLNSIYFKCDKVVTLAAPKKVLYKLPEITEVYIADLGIPIAVYEKFKVNPLGFDASNILKLDR